MLTIDHLIKNYGASKRRLSKGRSPEATTAAAVDDVSFEVQEGELFTLLGPSGCGKTTTLRSVAGLERPDSGSIKLKDLVLFDSADGVNVPVNKRGLGMVFQSYAIWPHMTVHRNIAFPLEVLPRAQRPSKQEQKERVERALEVTGLTAYADRPATKLSGGQQQRLALARATVMAPPLMLLDEPLSNLDATLRESMRFELKRLQRELGITSIYVTHDQSEALVLSSRIAVMNAGHIIQVGKPREIYLRPVDRFVAEFVGVSNFVDGVVGANVDGQTKISTPEGDIWTSQKVADPLGSEVSISLRPEALEIIPDDASIETPVNDWRGNVVTRSFLGESSDHMVSVGKLELRIRSNPNLSVPPGTDVRITVKPEDVVVVPRS